MTADDTAPDLFPPLPPETERPESRRPDFERPESEGPESGRPGSEGPESGPRAESRLRPVERRVLQAVALVCAVSAVLTVYWVDGQDGIQQHLDPPEKVTTVPAGKIGELAGARWTVMKRADAPPPAGAARQGDGAVTELRLAVGVRPESETAAKTVASTGIVYRLVDDEGRRWSAADTRTRQPQAGVAMLVTLRAKVPLALADSLQLEIQAPETTRKEGDPLLSLRFEH